MFGHDSRNSGSDAFKKLYIFLPLGAISLCDPPQNLSVLPF